MIDILTSKLLSEAGFTSHGFTYGETDFSKKEGFAALQKQFEGNAPFFKVNQVHKTTVKKTSVLKALSDWQDAAEVEGDALICDTPGVVGVVTADCVPILLGCKETGFTAAIHAGWRGLSKGVVRNTIKTMLFSGAKALSIVAAIGPCICLSCYEVSKEVANFFPESSDPIKGKPDKFMLELPLAAEVSLIGAGLTSTHIDRLEVCTSCGDNSLFSYRKSGGECGRQLSFIERK